MHRPHLVQVLEARAEGEQSPRLGLDQAVAVGVVERKEPAVEVHAECAQVQEGRDIVLGLVGLVDVRRKRAMRGVAAPVVASELPAGIAASSCTCIAGPAGIDGGRRARDPTQQARHRYDWSAGSCGLKRHTLPEIGEEREAVVAEEVARLGHVRREELAVVAVVVTAPPHRPLCQLDRALALLHAGDAVPQVPMGRRFTHEELCTVPA